MRHRDTEVHGGSAAGDLLEIWLFDVDWQIPSNSSLTQATSIDVAEFDSDLCGTFSFSCIQQPGGGDLDPIREAIMNRLQYFHHDDGVETLVGNLATDVTGSDDAGIRWFELRRSGGAWQLHQEGTYTIDSDSRWMGASSMDSSKNIALAYSVSSTSTFPALRYTGRLADDPLGVMTQSETSIVEGVTSQPFDRFGDYAAMGLDPTDDCTFWFTGEAVGNGGS
ncbi:MAG: PKD domain-containing protein, partial [Actinomycetia bacterium]|nr:PKD domain-containing protein [Actinomycetes bacterium]